MKNTLKIDFAESRIIMDRTFAKHCENTASPEYKQLQRVRQREKKKKKRQSVLEAEIFAIM